MPDTILQLATDRLNSATTEKTKAADAVKKAVDAADKADKNAAGLAKLITAEAGTGADIRRRLAVAVEAAVAEGIVDELADHQVRTAALAVKAADSQQEVSLAKAALARATAAGARADTAAADAAKAKAQAKKDADAWQANVADAVEALRLRNPVFASAVQTVLNSNDYQKARDRVDADVPKATRDAARARVAEVRKAASDAVQAEEKAIDDVAAQAGAMAAATLDANRKRLRMRALVNAERDLAEARATLATINATPPLNPDMALQITGAGIALADAEKTVSDQNKAIEDKKAEILNPPAGTTAAGLQGQLDALEAALPALEQALDDARATGARVVPEGAWLRLLVFDDVASRLTELKKLTAVEIKGVSDACKDAEKGLANALKAEADARDAAGKLQQTLDECRDVASTGRELSQTRVLAALRSDA